MANITDSKFLYTGSQHNESPNCDQNFSGKMWEDACMNNNDYDNDVDDNKDQSID